MSKSEDPSLLTAEHFESIQFDLLKREFEREGQDQAAELVSLQAFNAQLLERVGEFRKRNLELSAVETALRAELAAQEKVRTDLSRKLAKLTDEVWAKDLEIEGLRNLNSEQSKEIDLLKEETPRAIEALKVEHQGELNALAKSNAELKEESERLSVDCTEAENRLGQQAEAFRAREAQLIQAFENLRTEYSSIDRCYRESTEIIAQLRSDLHNSDQRSQEALAILQGQLQMEFQRQFEAALIENRKLKNLLEARDSRNETERARLQTWAEKLGFLENHLRQCSESLKKDRIEALKLAKQLAQELQFVRSHPFKEYFDAADLEVAQLSSQLEGSSTVSPSRQKLEARYARAVAHRDAMKAAIVVAEKQFENRMAMIQAIIKQASAPA